ncbi:MAG: glycosyltransferase family 2 protein [Clostridia bacterium]|nr:glycosyltransferase family 2 protein [Clostridia bacterium]
MGDVLYFVIPCYYDEDTLLVTAPIVEKKLLGLMEKGMISPESRVLFVNDGSTDGTWETIREFHEKSPYILGVNLARNSGAQNAMLAGMYLAADKGADLVITMDSDLQDDIEAVDEMVDRYLAGCDMVFGVRSARKRDSFFEKFTSEAFYSFMGSFNPRLIREHANYRLMSRKAVAMLREYDEESFFMPVLVASLGLKTAVVYHERFPRAAGTSNYNFRRRLRLGIDAALSHTSAPVKLFSLFAAVCLLMTVVCAAVWIALCVRDGAFHGGMCVVTSLWLVGFILNACLRILGEYLYKAFLLSKKRPLYQVDDILE